jgi:glycerophosphoryl diester phosphodiesterase
MPALEAAIRRGYDMVEMDMRLTKDGMLIINHDRNFKRYYGVDSAVSDMDWNRIQQLRGPKGIRVVSLEQAFATCRKGHIQVMIDNKFEGYDTLLFARVVALLNKYGLRKKAIMIGTDSSADYFTGKVRLSCTRRQLEDNMKKPGYSPDHYYLFGNVKSITADDVKWAKQNGIMVIAAVNILSYHRNPDYLKQAAADIDMLKARGVKRFQIDSNFDGAFFLDK